MHSLNLYGDMHASTGLYCTVLCGEVSMYKPRLDRRGLSVLDHILAKLP